MSDEYDDELDDDAEHDESDLDGEAEYDGARGELCSSCGEYLLDGSSGDIVECPICGARTQI